MRRKNNETFSPIDPKKQANKTFSPIDPNKQPRSFFPFALFSSDATKEADTRNAKNKFITRNRSDSFDANNAITSNFAIAMFRSATFRSIMTKLFLAILVAAAALVIVAVTVNPSSLPGVLPAVVAGLASYAVAIFGTAVGVGAASTIGFVSSCNSTYDANARNNRFSDNKSVLFSDVESRNNVESKNVELPTLDSSTLNNI